MRLWIITYEIFLLFGDYCAELGVLLHLVFIKELIWGSISTHQPTWSLHDTYQTVDQTYNWLGENKRHLDQSCSLYCSNWKCQFTLISTLHRCILGGMSTRITRKNGIVPSLLTRINRMKLNTISYCSSLSPSLFSHRRLYSTETTLMQRCGKRAELNKCSAACRN